MSYREFFERVTGNQPFPYQERLASGPWPEVIDVPTGLGKTDSVVVAWLHRTLRSCPDTGRRIAREVLGVDDEILTIRELAALRKIGENTAYTMAQRGELTAFEVRDQCRFRWVGIDAWIAEKVQRSDHGPEDE